MTSEIAPETPPSAIDPISRPEENSEAMTPENGFEFSTEEITPIIHREMRLAKAAPFQKTFRQSA